MIQQAVTAYAGESHTTTLFMKKAKIRKAQRKCKPKQLCLHYLQCIVFQLINVLRESLSLYHKIRAKTNLAVFLKCVTLNI